MKYQKISKKEIYNSLINLGLRKGMFVNLKCSYASLGNLEGGLTELIEIILDIIKEDGLLVTDSFVNCYLKNSKKIKDNIITNNSVSYAGLIANEILKHKDCYRSKHPIQKFALIGNDAEKLSLDHNESSYAFDILKIMSEFDNSYNLKIGSNSKVLGVGTTHVASGILNIEKYEQNLGVYYINKKSKIFYYSRNWIGLCRKSLINLSKFYEENENIYLKKNTIGNTVCLLTKMKDTLREEINLFKKDQTYLECNDENCFECFTFKKNYKNRHIYFTKNILKLKFKNIIKMILQNKLVLQPTLRINDN